MVAEGDGFSSACPWKAHGAQKKAVTTAPRPRPPSPPPTAEEITKVSRTYTIDRGDLTWSLR